MSQHKEKLRFTAWSAVIIVWAAAAALFVAYDVELYIKVVSVLTLPVALGYPLAYSTLPWKQTVLGKALMTHARSVALLYLVAIFDLMVDLPLHGYLMAFVATYLFIGIGFQFAVMLKIKHDARLHRLTHQEQLDDQTA